MNTFLIIYLIILISEAIISTILKYTWQAEEKWDEPWYNQKTEHQRNSSKVSFSTHNFAINETGF
jgi:phospholipid-translocating ATPase